MRIAGGRGAASGVPALIPSDFVGIESSPGPAGASTTCGWLTSCRIGAGRPSRRLDSAVITNCCRHHSPLLGRCFGDERSATRARAQRPCSRVLEMPAIASQLRGAAAIRASADVDLHRSASPPGAQRPGPDVSPARGLSLVGAGCRLGTIPFERRPVREHEFAVAQARPVRPSASCSGRGTASARGHDRSAGTTRYRGIAGREPSPKIANRSVTDSWILDSEPPRRRSAATAGRTDFRGTSS